MGSWGFSLMVILALLTRRYEPIEAQCFQYWQ
jgi:hypothetical protein